MNTKPIKTVHITNYYHKTSGGISTSYNYLLEYADRHRRPIALIVPGEKDAVENFGEFAKIYYVEAKPSPFFDKRYRIIMPWQFMKPDSKIREILLDEKPDLIEICDKYALSMMAAMIRKNSFKRLGRPLLVHFSCERMDDNIAAYLTKGRIGRWLAQKLMGNYNAPLYDFFIANSAYTAGEYKESVLAQKKSGTFFNFCWRFFRAAKLPLENRIFICSRGGTNPIFSTDHWSETFQNEIRNEIGIPLNSKILFYAGRISPEKNIGVLLELMEVLKKVNDQDYRLLVAGDGPKKDWFQNEAETRVHDKIKMLGHITDKQKLAKLYANCDVFVHPNPREPYGIGPLEAMASGVPVVAPNSGGILTYATQENAWLVEPTAENFARAIKEILADESQTKQKVNRALQTVKNSSWEKSSEEVFSVYEKIYQEFQTQNEIFAYNEKPRGFHFAKETVL